MRITAGKSRRIATALCLAIAVVLTGCDGDSETVSKKSRVKLETGDIIESSIVMSVGDVGVAYKEIRNYCYLLKRQYEDSFGEKLWKYSLGEEGTVGDEAKQEIVNTITQMKVIQQSAAEQNISLAADERDEAVQKAEQVFKSASAQDREKYFLSVQNLTSLYEEHILANKMFYIATDEADTDISDNEAKQISIQYLQIMTEGTDANGTVISMDKATKKAAMQRTKRLRKEILNGADFLEVAMANTDSNETELVIGRDTDKLEKVVVEAAFALKKNEVSKVVTGENGYYLVCCVNSNNEDATYARKEEIIEERQAKMFQDKYAEWLKGCDVQISEMFWDDFVM